MRWTTRGGAIVLPPPSFLSRTRIPDRLRTVEKAGWRTPAEHPDLVPAAEAGLLADLQRNIDSRELASRSRTSSYA